MDDSVVMESTGANATLSTEEYKVNVYFPILDAVLCELRERFASRSISIMKAIQSCNLQAETFLDLELLKPLTDHYGMDYQAIQKETEVAKHTLASSSTTSGACDRESISDVLQDLTPLTQAFPSLVELFKITLTIAVSSADCVSASKRVKSYLRCLKKD